jgi:ABC-type oligopeptide transport system substrate-binding subunit
LPAETFIPKGMHGYAADLGSTQTFDVARARATFAASGVSAKDLSAVKFSYDQSSDFSKATAKFIHDQLKTNLGVDITLEALDSNTLSSRLDTGDFQIAGPLGWMADYPDPSDWFGIFLTTSSNNFAFYQNKQYDSFVKTAGSDIEPDRRAEEYKQAQGMLANDVPVAFLAQTVSWYLVRPYVRGVTTTSVDEWPGALFPAQIYIAAH